MPAEPENPQDVLVAEENRHLPTVVVGAGPIGLAAAARLAERGLAFKVFEAADSPGANIAEWGHVHVFTPWKYLTDEAGVRLLAKQGWVSPGAEGLPTGREFIDEYLQPLADTPEIAPSLVFGSRVVSVTRRGMDKVRTAGRDDAPFQVVVEDGHGKQSSHLAAAVIDASGTWATPNPLGAGGVPASGETSIGDRLSYGIPDVAGKERSKYAGKSTLVVGAGHSAANVILDLLGLVQDHPDTTVTWAVRGRNLTKVFGGGVADDLPARGQLGSRLRQAVEDGVLTMLTGFAVESVEGDSDSRVKVRAEDGSKVVVDLVVAATGQRPDLDLARELRLDLDPWLESPVRLASLIDPNLHSCGSVPPHGFDVLSHPEKGFFTVGIKSYGRAPTFLMMTGYEQVRSIVAALDGDLEAARNLELVLPETGVCVTNIDPSPSGADNNAAEAACCGVDSASTDRISISGSLAEVRS